MHFLSYTHPHTLAPTCHWFPVLEWRAEEEARLRNAHTGIVLKVWSEPMGMLISRPSEHSQSRVVTAQ